MLTMGTYKKNLLFVLEEHHSKKPPENPSTINFELGLGSQHPSPDVQDPLRVRAAIWLKFITSRDAQSTCFKDSRTSCDVIMFGDLWPFFAGKDHIT